MPGTGGLSMGVDDSLRGGRTWAGANDAAGAVEAITFFGRLDALVDVVAPSGGGGGGPAAPPISTSVRQATWALEMHHAFTRAHGASGGVSSAALAALCTVTLTDDLRKGTEVMNSGGSGPLASFSLAVLRGGSSDSDSDSSGDGGDGVGGRVRVSRVSARAPNRRTLDVQVVSRLTPHATGGGQPDVRVVAGGGTAPVACAAVGLPPDLAARCLAVASSTYTARSGDGGGSGSDALARPTAASSTMEFLSLSVEVGA